MYTGVRELVFHSNPANSQEKMFENRINYTEGLLDKQITVKIGTSNGNVPSKPFISTIRKAIDNAME